MQLPAHATSRAPRSRPGFTLVELMVVIAIIGIIVTLAASATMQVITRQKAANTEATIQKVNDALKARWRAVVDQAKEEFPSRIPDNILQGLLAMASDPTNPGGDMARARVIWIKLRLKQAFPMNFMEALNPTPGTIRPSYVALPPAPAFAGALRASDAKDPPQYFESSVCLLLALARASRGVTSFDEDRLAASEKADSGVNGLKMIVDGWGRPLTFYRWPMPDELKAANPNKTGAYGDPLDTEGLLMAPGWNNPQAYAKQQGVWAFEKLLHPVRAGNKPASYYTVPVVASAGSTIGSKQPGQPYPYLNVYDFMGLPQPPQESQPVAGLPTALRHDPMQLASPTSDAAFDNLYSFRMRLGARGD